MIAYVGHLLGLLGASLGLIGNTWDKKRRGWRRLTRSGRGALVIIVAGFALSVSSTYSEHEKHRRLQAVAATEIEQAWRPLIYPFTLMLWEIRGQSVGYEPRELESLLSDDVQQRIRAIDLLGEAPHYAESWRSVLSSSTLNGREALQDARETFYPLLDDNLIVAIQEVLGCYYLEVLSGAEGFISKVESDPHWAGQPYPLENLSDFNGAQRYLSALITLRAELDKHLPNHEEV
jgi:hypothetical protein